MISALTGQLRGVNLDRVELEVGAMLFELLAPAFDLEGLAGKAGVEMVFHTIFYLEGDASRGSLTPRLIGFVRKEDRRFFELFTTVKGIGPKTALRAFTIPVGQIAAAIEGKDTRVLVELKGIGKRTAELIVAELAGKVGEFVTAAAGKGAGRRLNDVEEDAVSALTSLGERRVEAEGLLERVRQSKGKWKTADELVREMLSFRNSRS